MNATLLKTFRNVVLGAFLVAGCGMGEPIPVNLETATEPCEYGRAFMTEGMKMVMRDGQLMVVPKDEGRVQAMGGTTASTGCATGCH